MSFFENSNRARVTGLTVTQIEAAAGSSITVNNYSGAGSTLDKISAAAAHSAMHDSSARFPAPRCHRNTRTTYLDGFEHWLLGLAGDYDSKRLIWLNGGAGAGKSAIMQSLVERCLVHAAILGTFFFSRTDSSRNYAEVLIPTLAYQLACDFPSVMDVLEPSIQRRPGIFKTSLITQAHELLVRPLLHLVKTGAIDNTSRLRRVFVIDGLDECQDAEKQAHIIHVVATILCDHDIPVCFLIASRPETAISRAFHGEKQLHPIFSSVTLDDNADATADVRQFIEDSFLDILDVHPLRAHIPANWPDPYDVHQLVEKSSGHFIHAATAMKYISSSEEHPSRALEVVKGLMPSRIGQPFAELDALYLHILSSAKYSSHVLQILRHCIFTELDTSVKAVCFMHPRFSPEDIELYLSDVQALVSLSPNHMAEMTITLKHASLGDFFRDADRSQSIFVSRGDYRASLLPNYLLLLGDDSPFLFSQLENYIVEEVIHEINDAILHTRDITLLQSLISKYSPQIVWNFCLRYEVNNYSSDLEWRASTILSVSSYMWAIRDSAANHDNALYIHHFKTFFQVLLDSIGTEAEPYYQIIPALLFSSSSSCLTSVARHLITYFPQAIHRTYADFLGYMRPRNVQTAGVTDPRSYEAIRSLPQAQISWGHQLANGVELVLQHLLGYTYTPEFICPNPHKQWLSKIKPSKHISQGSPKLSSAFYAYLSKLPTSNMYDSVPVLAFVRHGVRREDADNICRRRVQCFVYLQTVIHYLHKCDSTSVLAKLARKSLPKAALWFPKLMKRARAAMDLYVRRWDDSLDGLMEKSLTWTINRMD